MEDPPVKVVSYGDDNQIKNTPNALFCVNMIYTSNYFNLHYKPPFCVDRVASLSMILKYTFTIILLRQSKMSCIL